MLIAGCPSFAGATLNSLYSLAMQSVRLSDAAEVVLRGEGARGDGVLRVRGARHRERGVVAPLVGIADFALEGVELGQRRLLRFRSHPAQCGGVFAQSGDEVVDQR